MASPATPVPDSAPSPPPPDPQAIRACLTSALADEFDSEWEIALESAKQSKNLAEVHELLSKWGHTAYLETRDPESYSLLLAEALSTIASTCFSRRVGVVMPNSSVTCHPTADRNCRTRVVHEAS
jgi:hypothetical protein